jgi:hypothetical protein
MGYGRLTLTALSVYLKYQIVSKSIEYFEDKSVDSNDLPFMRSLNILCENNAQYINNQHNTVVLALGKTEEPHQ